MAAVACPLPASAQEPAPAEPPAAHPTRRPAPAARRPRRRLRAQPSCRRWRSFRRRRSRRPRPRRRRSAPRSRQRPRPRRSLRRAGRDSWSPAPAASTAAPCLMSPVDGSAIPIGKYPGRASAAPSPPTSSAPAITYVPEVLQQTVPGVILEDAQGNVFQKNLQFRGFDSSPVNGVPQGLAVYQNGVRINEAFGDIVNWDFLPDNAIDGMTIIGANPVFGLNALGGAVTIFDARWVQLSRRRARRARRLVRPLPGRAHAGRQQRAPGAASWRWRASTTAATATSRPRASAACTPTSAPRATAPSST